MSSTNPSCSLCSKECKSSDSRPYPNSSSKDRIHNRCYIKKTLADKKQKSAASSSETPLSPDVEKKGPGESQFASSLKTPSVDLMQKMIEENDKRQNAAKVEKINQILLKQEGQSAKDREQNCFFFDVKAGIAKPHEKRQFLHHRKLCDMVARYDDHGHQEESMGRAYDHTGKDLNTLGDDDSDASLDERQDQKLIGKRKTTNYQRGRNKKINRTIRVNEKNPCWFCLSSPNVEKHLIIAIGDHCYLTLAKGGLTDQHFLLLPIEHIQSLNHPSNSQELQEELQNFKSSLIRYFKDQSNGVVFFERNFKSVHWQLQVVPVSLGDIHKLHEKIKSVSAKHVSNSNYIDIPSGCSIGDIVPSGAPYLYWQIEPTHDRFACQIEVGKDSFFPVQLPRIILANELIMSCQDRVDWRKCVKSPDEYSVIVRDVKTRYKPYDITSEDDQ